MRRINADALLERLSKLACIDNGLFYLISQEIETLINNTDDNCYNIDGN